MTLLDFIEKSPLSRWICDRMPGFIKISTLKSLWIQSTSQHLSTHSALPPKKPPWTIKAFRPPGSPEFVQSWATGLLCSYLWESRAVLGRQESHGQPQMQQDHAILGRERRKLAKAKPRKESGRHCAHGVSPVSPSRIRQLWWSHITNFTIKESLILPVSSISLRSGGHSLEIYPPAASRNDRVAGNVAGNRDVQRIWEIQTGKDFCKQLKTVFFSVKPQAVSDLRSTVILLTCLRMTFRSGRLEEGGQ